MGGNVSVKSTIGQGTIFKIDLTTICNIGMDNNEQLSSDDRSAGSFGKKVTIS